MGCILFSEETHEIVTLINNSSIDLHFQYIYLGGTFFGCVKSGQMDKWDDCDFSTRLFLSNGEECVLSTTAHLTILDNIIITRGHSKKYVTIHVVNK